MHFLLHLGGGSWRVILTTLCVCQNTNWISLHNTNYYVSIAPLTCLNLRINLLFINESKQLPLLLERFFKDSRIVFIRLKQSLNFSLADVSKKKLFRGEWQFLFTIGTGVWEWMMHLMMCYFVYYCKRLFLYVALSFTIFKKWDNFVWRRNFYPDRKVGHLIYFYSLSSQLFLIFFNI